MKVSINDNCKINLYNPNFQRVDYMREIKRIPGVTCACCGGKVIMEEAVKKAYTTVSKPLINIIKNGWMDKWQEFPMIWKTLNVFAQVNPKESLDKMLKRDEEFVLLKKAIVKDVTGDPNKTTRDPEEKNKILDIFATVVNDSRSELKTAKTVISRFSVFKPYLDEMRGEVFELLEIYSKKFPRKSLKEIINEPNINKTHGLKNSLQRNLVSLKREHYIDEIETLIGKTNPQALKDLEEEKTNILNIINRIKDNRIKEYKLKELYTKILSSNNCLNLQDKVNELIDKIPLEYGSADYYFVSCAYKNSNDFEIINNIIAPYISSYDHIIARASGGKDEIGNGLTFHTKCNRNRGKMHYNEFSMYYPEMIKYTKKQIDYISGVLLKGKASDYLRYWPLKVSKNLIEYTDGKFAPDVTEYCKKRLKQIEKKLKGKTPEPGSDEARQINVFTKYLKEH